MKKTLAFLAVLGLVVAGCSADAGDDEVSTSDEAALTTNSDAHKVLVYSNNVENMVYDWKDLLYFMKLQPSRPDIFLVQQMTDRARLDELTTAMSKILGVAYAGEVAQDHPTNVRVGDEVTPRPTVTTGIIYRVGRFDELSHDTWFPFGATNTTGATDCSLRHDSSSYETIRLRLHDKVANRDVTVVSLRHPTGAPCPGENFADIDARLRAHEDLTIVGGDFNDNPTDVKPGGSCWYRSVVGKMTACAGAPGYHFSDPLYDDCAGDMTCVKQRQNIDFIFGRNDLHAAKTSAYVRASFEDGNAANIAVKGSDGLSNTTAKNGFEDATTDYSQHKARAAFFWYR